MEVENKDGDLTFHEITDIKLSLPFVNSDRQLKEEMTKKDDHPYINYNHVEFPLIIDAETVIFAGRIGEAPTYAEFSIRNPMNIHFHYKIKSSSNAHFKVLHPVGMIRRHDTVTISVMAFPLVPIPKPFTHYLHVYVKMGCVGEDATPIIVWRGPKRSPEYKKRLYADFFYHPNIDRARAALLASDVMKCRDGNNFRISNETSRIRNGCIQLIMKILERDMIRGQMEAPSDYDERMRRVAAWANDPRKLRRFLETPNQAPNISELLWPHKSEKNTKELREKLKWKVNRQDALLPPPPK